MKKVIIYQNNLKQTHPIYQGERTQKQSKNQIQW